MSNADSSLSLSKALVRIRYQDSQDFAGCGILLNKQFIVTCNHVLQTALGDDELKLGALFSSFLPGHPSNSREPKLKLVQYYSEKEGDVGSADIEDLALLEIEGGLEVNDLLMAAPHEHKETQNGFTVKSSVDSDVSTSICIGVSNEGWLIIQLENKEQIIQKGDSGSAVWNDTLKAVTAMVVARKKDKGLCYAIPMYKIIQAFSGYLSKDYISPPDLFKDEDNNYLKEIKKDVERDLKNSALFRKHINARCEIGSESPDTILGYMISQCHNGRFGELIRSLRSAYVDGVEELDNRNIRGVRDLQRAARGVVSKLVVFTIKQEEILRLKGIHSKGTVASPLSNLSTPAAAGVVARTICSPMSLMRKGCGRLEGDSHVSLESGFKTEGSNSVVDMLLIQIAAKVIPSLKVDKSKKDTWKADLVKQLKETIKLNKEDPDIRFKRLYFFIIPLGEDVLSEKHQNVMKQLKSLLSDVTFFYITSEYADNVLTVDDVVIEAALRSFFIILDEYNEQ